VINRRKFNGDFQQGVNVWAGFVAQEAAIEPQMEFSIIRFYDVSTRRLDVIIDGRAKVPIPHELRVSIMIAENGIIDAQDDAEAGAIVDDYVHNHVLRDMLTPFDGQVFATSLNAGEEFHMEFTYVMSDDWDSARSNVIAFISVNNGSDINVLQAGEIHVTQ
jgi:hypothetical protein